MVAIETYTRLPMTPCGASHLSRRCDHLAFCTYHWTKRCELLSELVFCNRFVVLIVYRFCYGCCVGVQVVANDSIVQRPLEGIIYVGMLSKNLRRDFCSAARHFYPSCLRSSKREILKFVVVGMKRRSSFIDAASTQPLCREFLSMDTCHFSITSSSLNVL